jgi:hypothetical protein
MIEGGEAHLECACEQELLDIVADKLCHVDEYVGR